MNLSLPVVLSLSVLMVAGAGLSVQAPINAVLTRHAGNLLVAASISLFVSFALIMILVLARGDWSAAGNLGQAPWWVWVGGSFGVIYILATTWSVPIVGVLTMQAAVILGQVVAALVLDRIGAFGLPVHEITWPRILGVVMIAGGLIMTRA